MGKSTVVHPNNGILLLFSPWVVSDSETCQATLSMRFSQTRILEWVAISFSKGSSQSKDWTCVSCTGRQFLYNWATREAPVKYYSVIKWNELPSHEKTWRNFRCIRLRGRSPSQEATDCMILTKTLSWTTLESDSSVQTRHQFVYFCVSLCILARILLSCWTLTEVMPVLRRHPVRSVQPERPLTSDASSHLLSSPSLLDYKLPPLPSCRWMWGQSLPTMAKVPQSTSLSKIS